MNAFIVIGIGGACGSIARYAISTWMNGSTGLFPVGTFIVNALGCFILGFLFSYSEQKLSDTLYKGIGTGFCGGFTTFSAFSLESYSLWKNHHIVEAFLYTSSSFIVGLAAITAGIILGGLIRK